MLVVFLEDRHGNAAEHALALLDRQHEAVVLLLPERGPGAGERADEADFDLRGNGQCRGAQGAGHEGRADAVDQCVLCE
ncbi:hypothetical protein D3C87_1306700 [compost metagenome]